MPLVMMAEYSGSIRPWQEHQKSGWESLMLPCFQQANPPSENQNMSKGLLNTPQNKFLMFACQCSWEFFFIMTVPSSNATKNFLFIHELTC